MEIQLLNDFLTLETMWYFQEVLSDVCESKDETLSSYIDKLHLIIEEQRKALSSLCQRIKQYQQTISVNHVSTQTDASVTQQKQTFSDSGNKNSSSIKDVVKKAAEDAMKQTGFVYEATSGLYYDYNTGYYYNAELGLYYDGNTGMYYYFDKEKNQFQFHSQVAVPETSPSETLVTDDSVQTAARKRKEKQVVKTRKKLKKKGLYEIEEGECSEESSHTSDGNSDDDDTYENEQDQNSSDGDRNKRSHLVFKEPELDEFQKAWPPCMRIIVKETSVKSLKLGKLFVVTCTGGTLGREGDHSILIPDMNISKYHAKLSFDIIDEKKEIGNYTITDLGSRNGTFVQGTRLSMALQESEPHVIFHDSIVRVGGTTLLCHVHSGRDTCAECEPGLLINDDEKHKAYVPEENLSRKRKDQLKKLKQKFGLNNSEQKLTITTDYKDRAEIRRQTVGSYNDSFKTEVSSVTVPIKNTNRGFKMLSKMGWCEGQSLGLNSENGIKDPIAAQQRGKNLGLGCDNSLEVEIPEVTKKKQELWKKVQHRYKNLE